MQPADLIFFNCADGHKMPVHKWLPPGPCKAIVFLIHGMAEHGGRYAGFAGFLNNSGIGLYAADLRGHGMAVPAESLLGVAGPGWVNKQINDLYDFVNNLKQAHPNLPVFLFGHSMGSFLAQRYVQLYGNTIRGLVLSGTNGKKDPLLVFGIGLSRLLMSLRGPSFRSNLINKLTFGKYNLAFKPARTKFDWLSRDNQEVDKYVNDPFCGFISSVEMLYYLFVSLDITFSEAAMVKIPKTLQVYIFAGDKDAVGMQGKGVKTLIENWEAAGIGNISFKLYRDGRHEMLNDINKTEVMTDCLNWMLGRV
ncbi:MAG: alpha/beta fold hydrolase [Bacteroidota bacterium]